MRHYHDEEDDPPESAEAAQAREARDKAWFDQEAERQAASLKAWLVAHREVRKVQTNFGGPDPVGYGWIVARGD
jgi:hypothetical protein